MANFEIFPRPIEPDWTTMEKSANCKSRFLFRAPRPVPRSVPKWAEGVPLWGLSSVHGNECDFRVFGVERRARSRSAPSNASKDDRRRRTR
jgi:hypothetical protein